MTFNPMNMKQTLGWKPLPLIFKIIWVLQLVGVSFSISAVFSAAAVGFTVFGFTVYGLWAANLMFLFNLVLPVILLTSMWRRLAWAWKYGLGLYLLTLINELFIFHNFGRTVLMVAEGLPDTYQSMPNIMSLVEASLIVGVILGAALDVFFGIMFIVKRQYFTASEQVTPPATPRSSQD